MLRTACHIVVHVLMEKLGCDLRLQIRVDLVQIFGPALRFPVFPFVLFLVAPRLFGLPHGYFNVAEDTTCQTVNMDTRSRLTYGYYQDKT